MKDEDSWFECPICCINFNDKDRKPMIICMSQHTICKVCVQDMFKGKNKQTDEIACCLCRQSVKYNSITLFHWLNELNQRKQSLRCDRSKLKKELTSDINQLKKQVIKEREKNDWLLQFLEQSKLKSKQTKEALEKHMTQEMNEMKRSMKEENRQQTNQIKKLLETFHLQTRQSLKQQINLRKEESFKAIKQEQQEIIKKQNLLEKKIDSLKIETTNLNKQLIPFQQNIHQFEQNNSKALKNIQQTMIGMNDRLKQALEHRSAEDDKNQVVFLSPFSKKTSSQCVTLAQQAQTMAAPCHEKARAGVNLPKKQEIKPYKAKEESIQRLKTQPDIHHVSKTINLKHSKEFSPSNKPLTSRKQADESYRSHRPYGRSNSTANLFQSNTKQLIECQQNKKKHYVQLLSDISEDQGLLISNKAIQKYIEQHIYADEEQILSHFYKNKNKL